MSYVRGVMYGVEPAAGYVMIDVDDVTGLSADDCA